MRRIGFLAAFLMVQAFASCGAAAEKPKYSLAYSVRFQPEAGTAAVQIATQPESGRLIGLDLDMPASVYSDVTGDGVVVRRGSRVIWEPPRAGGALNFTVVVAHRRDNGQFDARITPEWVITRGDRLVPAAKVRATKGSGSTAKLRFELPRGWTDVETPFSKVAGGAFAVTNPERSFDRPVGWIAAGDLASMRETIAGVRTTITAPKGERVDLVATFAILRQALPKMREAFGELPEKLLLIRSGDPMWRGGLSAPGSLWLHLDRPLISENGTSTLLHELTHVFTDIRGEQADDWIGEGLAEYYSLEIARRAGLISQGRFAKAIAAADRSGSNVDSLHSDESTKDRTRKAVALFAALDEELRADGNSDIDALTRLLMRRESVSLGELRIAVKKLEGKDSKVLAGLR